MPMALSLAAVAKLFRRQRTGNTSPVPSHRPAPLRTEASGSSISCVFSMWSKAALVDCGAPFGVWRLVYPELPRRAAAFLSAEAFSVCPFTLESSTEFAAACREAVLHPQPRG